MQSKKSSLWSTIKSTYLKTYNLNKFYLNFDKSKIPQDLNEMLQHFIFDSKSHNWSSKFWKRLIINHLNLINSNKRNFSEQQIYKEYFTWTYFNKELISDIVSSIKNTNTKLNINIFKKHKYFNYVESINHNVILYLLYLNIRNKKVFKLFIKNKKLLLNKPTLLIEGVNISQDNLNSLYEYEKILQIINRINNKKNFFLEIGSGSGRTAQTILLLKEKIKYVIVDIPPALYISYSNTKKIFPKKRICLAYKKNKYELLKEINKNDVTYIFPHQIEMLPDKMFDISIAIDCLHEMEEKIVKRYMANFERVSQSLYFKVWENASLPNSFFKNYSAHNENDYFIKKKWKKIFKEKCIFPSNYYQLGYKF